MASGAQWTILLVVAANGRKARAPNPGGILVRNISGNTAGWTGDKDVGSQELRASSFKVARLRPRVSYVRQCKAVQSHFRNCESSTTPSIDRSSISNSDRLLIVCVVSKVPTLPKALCPLGHNCEASEVPRGQPPAHSSTLWSRLGNAGTTISNPTQPVQEKQPVPPLLLVAV